MAHTSNKCDRVFRVKRRNPGIRKGLRIMSRSNGHLRSGLKLFFAAAIAWISSNAAGTAADGYVPFVGEKTTWHEGFDRYDFIMDDATGAITPMTAPASEMTSFGIDESVKGGKRRSVVVVPR